MKKFISFICCLFLVQFCNAETSVFTCALGSASPQATFGTLSLDDFYEVSVTSAMSGWVWNCGCDADYRQMQVQPGGRFAFPQLAISSYNPSASISGWVMEPGMYYVSAQASSGTSCGHAWGCSHTLSITFGAQCPNTSQCVKSHCPYCQMDYCAVHKRHITRFVSHNFNTLPGVPAAEHAHCSNSEQLLSEWQSNASQRICPSCGMPFCPLCPHTCGEFSCPNTPNCTPCLCPVCNGNYCSVHSFHVCSNYHEAAEHQSNNLVSVQTSVSGQAIVNVDIAPANINIDQTGVISAINNGALLVNTSVSASTDAINTLDSHAVEGFTRIQDLLISTETSINGISPAVISSMDSNTALTVAELSSLNDIAELINSHTASIPALKNAVDAQLTPILDIESHSAGILISTTAITAGVNLLHAEVVDFSTMTSEQLLDLQISMDEGITSLFGINTALAVQAPKIDSIDNSLKSIDETLKNGGDNQAVVSAINSLGLPVVSAAQSAAKTADYAESMNTKMNVTYAKLGDIETSINGIQQPLSDINGLLTGLGEGSESIAQSLTEMNQREKDDAAGTVELPTPSYSVESDFVSPYDGVVGTRPSISSLNFEPLKAKLFPPSSMFSNLSSSSVLTYQLPLIGSFSLDLLSDNTSTIRSFVFAVFSISYLFAFVTGVATTLRQY